MYLMLKNTPVLRFNIDNNEYEELSPEKIPFRMKNSFWKDDSVNGKIHNYNILIDYLSSRTLDIGRENAKKLLNAYHLTQSQAPIDRAKVAITCKAVSATDSYWLCAEEDLGAIKWEDVDPKRNSLSDIVAHIALSGTSLTLTGNPHTPELTNHGSYAKAWIRENGTLYLYKKDTSGNRESEIEKSVSKILDCCNVEHVSYKEASFRGKSGFCKCKNMCTDDLDIVTAEDVFTYCNRHGKDFMNEALRIDRESIYKMCIVDYLVSNADRHMQNWGFYVNNNTGHLLCCHPLFDHNNAFDESTMKNPDGGDSLIFPGKSKKEVALYSMKKCDFRFLEPIHKNIFPSQEAYDSFRSRAKELELCKERKQTWKEKVFRQGPFSEFVVSSSVPKINYERLVQCDNESISDGEIFSSKTLDGQIKKAQQECRESNSPNKESVSHSDIYNWER